MLLLIPVGLRKITCRCWKQRCDLAFQNVSDKIHVPIINFDDLGKGFSGDVEGKERELLNFYFRL
jgi:hypothetical protein